MNHITSDAPAQNFDTRRLQAPVLGLPGIKAPFPGLRESSAPDVSNLPTTYDLTVIPRLECQSLFKSFCWAIATLPLFHTARPVVNTALIHPSNQAPDKSKNCLIRFLATSKLLLKMKRYQGWVVCGGFGELSQKFLSKFQLIVNIPAAHSLWPPCAGGSTPGLSLCVAACPHGRSPAPRSLCPLPLPSLLLILTPPHLYTLPRRAPNSS